MIDISSPYTDFEKLQTQFEHWMIGRLYGSITPTKWSKEEAKKHKSTMISSFIQDKSWTICQMSIYLFEVATGNAIPKDAFIDILFDSWYEKDSI